MKANKIMAKSFIVNLTLGVLKFFGGVLSNSKTLLADGIHCLSDMSTDIIGIIGTTISNKKPDKEHPFGHGRIEYVTSMFISILIIILGVTIFANSFKEKTSVTSWYAFLIMIITIIVKIFLCKYLLKKGKRLNNSILITNGTESKYDVISSSVSSIFVLLSIFSGKIEIFEYADMIGSICISILTIKAGLTLFFENVNSVIGEVNNDDELINKVKNVLINYKEIKTIDRITIMKNGSYNEAIIDFKMNGKHKLKYLYNLETKIKKDIKSNINEIKYVTINIKPI